jgi:hypothetical protein
VGRTVTVGDSTKPPKAPSHIGKAHSSLADRIAAYQLESHCIPAQPGSHHLASMRNLKPAAQDL